MIPFTITASLSDILSITSFIDVVIGLLLMGLKNRGIPDWMIAVIVIINIIPTIVIAGRFTLLIIWKLEWFFRK